MLMIVTITLHIINNLHGGHGDLHHDAQLHDDGLPLHVFSHLTIISIDDTMTMKNLARSASAANVRTRRPEAGDRAAVEVIWLFVKYDDQMWRS